MTMTFHRDPEDLNEYELDPTSPALLDDLDDTDD
jgi:hypothetical protein